MKFAILLTAAYLLGSIPFGFIIAAAHGKDLRKIGSGNIGATNLSRALGARWAYFCFCLDVLKGLVPMLTAKMLIGSSPPMAGLLWTLAVGCAAILGHIFPLYLKFKGGKGVATSFGVALGFWPYYTVCAVISLVTWVVVVLLSRYVSLASILGALVFPIVLAIETALLPGWNFSNLWPLFIVAVAIPLIVIVRHKDNIKRIITGTESKIA